MDPADRAKIKGYADLVKMYVQGGKVDAAFKVLDEIFRLDAQYIPAMQTMGDLQLKHREDPDVAIGWYDKILELDAGNHKALNGMAEARLAKGDRDGATAAWRRSLAIDPDQADVRAHLEEMGAG